MQWTGVRDLPEVGGNSSAGLLAQAHSCIFLLPIVVKTSHFTATRWAEKTTGRIKARNSAERLSFSFSNKDEIVHSVLTRE